MPNSRGLHILRNRVTRLWGGIAILALASAPALAGPREQAKRIHDRLVGTPPSDAVLTSMANRISAGDGVGAAYEAMANPLFYTSTLKNFVTPWTNETGSIFDDLNDYTATVIGIIRDEVPFNQVLSADLVYVGAPGVVASPYSHMDNDHYEELESQRVDLSDASLFIATSQSSLAGTPLLSGDTAGVITTRAAARSFFSAGTNRRMWRFVSMNFLCRDLEDTKDITRPADRVRQDVTRSPGGDSSIFLNHCVGCHSGMDPLAQAFAYYEWDTDNERLDYSPGFVQGKYLINAETFPGGFITADDRWDNYWRAGPNALLGWRGNQTGGFGAKSLGAEVAASRAFSLCQAEKIFTRVCLAEPGSPADRAEVERVADVFESQNYSLKRIFAETATYCMGD